MPDGIRDTGYTRVYLQLPESAAADRLLSDAKDIEAAPLPLTWLHRVEILPNFRRPSGILGQRFVKAGLTIEF